MIDVLIPARGNSKGIKNKNLKKINDVELVCFSINFAKKLNLVSRIVVSTDSKKIAKVSKKSGASVPFIRPAKYATDNAKDIDVFTHYIKWLKKKKYQIPELVVHLRPTTPFRSLGVVNKAVKIISKNKKISSLRSMRRSNFSPFKMWFAKKNTAFPVIKQKKEVHSAGRQTLPETYDHIGYVDIVRVKKTIFNNTMVGDYVYPYILSKNQLKKFIDIDNLKDLYKAREIYRDQIIKK